MLVLDKYVINKFDEMNFVLYSRTTNEKGEIKDKFVGYYGYLGDALSKVVNLSLMEAIGDENTIKTTKDLLDALRDVEKRLFEDNRLRAKDYNGI